MLVKIEGIVTNKNSYSKDNKQTGKPEAVYSIQLLQQIPNKPATLVEVNVTQETFGKCAEMQKSPVITATIFLWSKDGRSGAMVSELK